LNPKKPKDLYAPVANEFNVTEKFVAELIECYWKDVKQAMLKGLSSNIILEGFGTFKAKPWKLPETIAKYERIHNKYKTLTDDPETASFHKFTILKETENRLNILNELQVKINQESEKQKQIKHKRYVGKTQKDMEEQSPNMGGILEPDDLQEND
jgi:nucleoid DNA-binding protein